METEKIGFRMEAMVCQGKQGFVVTDDIPVFSWICVSEKKGDGQAAYRVTVREAQADTDTAFVWDSGRVESSQNFCRAEGIPLRPRREYLWRVTVWNQDGDCAESGECCFETGKLTEAWIGKWISTTLCRRPGESKGSHWYKAKIVPKKKVKKARLYVCGVGLYEPYIEGEKVTEGRLTPAYTKYDSRVYYDVLDVTEQAKKPRFGLGILVGNGWYNYIELDEWAGGNATWRAMPRVIADLVLTYEDGSEETVGTGKEWRSIASPIVYDCVRNGEHYDESLERTDFSSFEDADDGWAPVRQVRGPGGCLHAAVIDPVVVAKEWEPVAMWQNKEGDWLIDFGQNCSGVMRMSFEAKAGQTVKVSYAEAPMEAMDRLRTDYLAGFVKSGEFQTDWYTAASDGIKTYEPHFVWHGFQVACVKGLEKPPLWETVKKLELHTRLEQKGYFRTSSEALNGIWNMCAYSTTSNMMGVPTSDPHREKNSWTGDGALMSWQFLLTFGGVDCMDKWLDDIADNQRPDGSISCIVPSGGWGYEWGNGPDWSKVVPQILWNLYQYTGRTDLLRKHYPMLKKLADWERTMCVGHIPEYGIGDWCAPFTGPSLAVNMRNPWMPLGLTDTACYYYTVNILQKVQRLLGEPVEEGLAEDIAAAFREQYVDEKEARVTGDCQTSYGCACYYHLCAPELEEKLFERMIEKLEEKKFHPDFGILGSEYVMRTLGEKNRGDLLYRLLMCEGFPGYRHWLSLGRNTLGECWNGLGSRNHFMFADVAADLYQYIAGICPMEDAPGFERILLTPGGMPFLKEMECRLMTVRGMYESSWSARDGKIFWQVEIPFGCSARVRLPEGVRIEDGPECLPQTGLENGPECLPQIVLESGRYQFVLTVQPCMSR